MPATLTEGFATAEGTEAYRARHLRAGVRLDFFNRTEQGLRLSSLGVGTYLGEPTQAGDEAYRRSIDTALRSGINVIDTAIKYRHMRSEKLIGDILAKAVSEDVLQRHEVFIASKGGLIGVPSDVIKADYIRTEIIGHVGIDPNAIIGQSSCLEPRFIEFAFKTSLDNLQLKTLDCYFLHNPEIVLKKSIPDFYDRVIPMLFTFLEGRVRCGELRSYGLASWTGFRFPPGSHASIDLERVLAIAKGIAGEDHHFRYLEVPLNVGMPVLAERRCYGSSAREATFLQYARALGFNILASGAVYGGRLRELRNLIRIFRVAGRNPPMEDMDGRFPVSLPQSYVSLVQLGELLLRLRKRDFDIWERLSEISRIPATDLYPLALNAVRSAPEITTALTSYPSIDFLRDNLRLAGISKIARDDLQRFWSDLAND